MSGSRRELPIHVVGAVALFPPQVLIPAAAVIATLTDLDLRVAAYVLLGFVLGPIFPTAVAWYEQHLTPRRLPIALTGGTVRAVAVQPLMGTAVSRFGVAAIPVTLIALACCLLALSVGVRWFQGTARARAATT